MRKRCGPKQPPAAGTDFAVVSGNDPRGGPLEHRHVRHRGLDGRHELHRRRAGADDRDPFTREVDVVIPPRGVEADAGEPVQAGQAGNHRVCKRTGGDDNVVGGPLTVCRLQAPKLLGWVPIQSLHGAVQHHLSAQPEPFGDISEVGVNFRPLGVEVAPARVWCERERIKLALHVDRGARIVVVAPDPADVTGAIQQNEIVKTGPSQTDRGRDATETGTDDRNMVVGDKTARHRGSESYRGMVVRGGHAEACSQDR
jgi:hypothetical protein